MLELNIEPCKDALCESHITAYIDGKPFILNCLQSGGSFSFDDRYNVIVEKGPWTIYRWPKDFPSEYKAEVLHIINDELEWGCCGRCVE